MAQLPDSIRPYAEALQKHHFWLLAGAVPLVLVPLLWLATAAMDGKMKTQKGKIDSQIAAVRKVASRTDHPNESWSKAVETELKAIRQETVTEWKRFWDGQQSLRVWPATFGDDFVGAVSALRPGGSLDGKFLERYLNMVPAVVRQLPGRMGAADAMTEGKEKSGPAAGRPAAGGGSRFLVTWSAEDQARLYTSFKWESDVLRSPRTATAQVVLAQEELWLYGMLCDFIRRANDKSTAAYDTVITDVEQLAVGYPAAEDRPGGQGGSRVIVTKGSSPEPPADGALPPPGGPAGPPTNEPAARPGHPRFGGAVAAPRAGGDAGGGAAQPASPDDPLREWIYVDFSGRPLGAAALGTNPEAQLVHLVPFVLRVVMDERRLDALMADIAASPIPIDVRQVRINADAGGGGATSAVTATGSRRQRRPYDVTVELRGTIALATPPDERVFDTLQPSVPGTPSAAVLPARTPARRARRWRAAREGVTA